MLEPKGFPELIRRIREKDEDAAKELIQRYESAIRRVIRIRLRDANLRRLLDSTDICQSVMNSFFVRTAMGQFELDTPEQLLNLLTKMARNKLANQASKLHTLRRDVSRDKSDGESTAFVMDNASDPSEQVSSKELLEKVRQGLNDDERYLAEQRAIGRQWQELADELGSTDVALRKKLTRAINRVMQELGLGAEDDV